MLLGHRVIQVACGSRDAQTLALTDEGLSVNVLPLVALEVHVLRSPSVVSFVSDRCVSL